MSQVLEQQRRPRYESAQAEHETETPVLAGYLAEYDSVDAVMSAADKVREAGYRRWDVHSPFRIHGIDDVMNIRPTILPWIVLAGGLFGLGGGLLMQWWTMAHDYKYMISGKPYFSLPAFIPVIFECTILCAAFAAVFGMLLLNKLPLHYNPLFKSERFRRVTDDRFFIAIESTDPKFEETRTRELLESTNPIAVESYED